MNNKIISKICYLIAIIVLVVILAYLCYGYYKKSNVKAKNPIVTMEVENFGIMKIELYPNIAEETVKNFVNLANNGFYNGLTFHRIVKDFMIQGGDKNGDGTGSPTFADLYNDEDTEKEYKYTNNNTAKSTDTYSILGEFEANGYAKNNLLLEKGTIAMARSDYSSAGRVREGYNSAGSQFFIMTTDEHTNLSGYYAGFGKVIEGLDVLEKIANVEVKAKDSEEETSSETEISTPVENVVIKSVSVETDGINYERPKTLEPFNYMKWLYSQYGLTFNE